MKRDRLESYQWKKFFEFLGFFPILIVAMLVNEVFEYFMNLKGTPWICFFIASFTLLMLGAAMIGFAKIPAYRSGRFFTFGIKSVPERLAAHYKWGWRLFLFGVILSLCLLLSK